MKPSLRLSWNQSRQVTRSPDQLWKYSCATTRGDIVEIGVGRGFLVGKHIGRVEDVEALVLHRPHVEVADRDDVEQVEVIFAAVDLLVPRHRQLEAVHRVLRLGQVGLAHPDDEIDLAAAHGGEAVAVGLKVAGDQREQIAGLGEGVVPLGPVTPVRRLAARDLVAVRQQHRERLRVALHPHAIFRQHVGPVGEEGDAAEALGLALGAEHAVRGIEAHQLGVGRGMDVDLGLDRRSVAGNVEYQRRTVHPVLGRSWPSTLTDTSFELVAVEPQRPVMVAVALDAQRRADACPSRCRGRSRG